MKTIITTLFAFSFLLFTNCKEEKKETSTKSASASEILITEKKSEKGAKDNALKQQGDYNSLFNRAPKDCSFISAETLATALNVNSAMVKPQSNLCTYVLKEGNGKEIRFHFIIEKWDNQKIRKEIKKAKENAEMFGKDSTLSQYRISDTGDTYLSMHQNRMVRILNEESDTVIVLLYTPKIDPGESNIETLKKIKGAARMKAYSIANYLLKEHQK